jgi:hypothetical protein
MVAGDGGRNPNSEPNKTMAGVPPSNNHAFGGTPESTGSGGGRGWLR